MSNASSLTDEIIKSPKEGEREMYMSMREAYLSMVNAIEVLVGINPTTAAIRKEYKDLVRKKSLPPQS